MKSIYFLSPHLEGLYFVGRPQLEMILTALSLVCRCLQMRPILFLAWIRLLIIFNSRAILCNLDIVTGDRTYSRRTVQTVVILCILFNIHPISFHIRRNSYLVQSNRGTRDIVFMVKATEKTLTIHEKVLI